MKKNRKKVKKISALFIVFLSAMILATAGYTGYKWYLKIKASNIMHAGSYARDFTVAYINSQIINLADLTNKYIIVLTFLDSSYYSRKLEEVIKKNHAKCLMGRTDIMWLNIKKEKSSAVINEITQRLKIKFRTPAEKIPGFYTKNIKAYPTLLIIDHEDTIRAIYRGFSPTFTYDMQDIIRGIVY